MPRRTLWLIFGVVVVSIACYERAERSPYGRWFSEALNTIDRYYVEPVDEQKLFEGALDGMVGRLDDYSAFFPRQENASSKRPSTSSTAASASRSTCSAPTNRPRS